MIDVFSGQHFRTLLQVADSKSAGVPIDGSSVDDETAASV